MANIHEALQRAEAERQRVAAGKPAGEVADKATAKAQAQPAPARFANGTRGKHAVRRLTVDGGEVNRRRISLLAPDSFIAEQFRSLRSRIEAIATQRPIRTIAVTSSSAGEGKSLASINFALVSSMSVGSRVLLVDCDMRRPEVGNTFGLNPEAGLAEVLAGTASLEQSIVRINETSLDVLPVKSMPKNPSELLASGAMRELLARVSASYDRVILDLPPVLGVPDAKTVSELSDGVLIVVRADKTRREEVEAALEVIDREKILGLVLNGVDEEAERYRYYY
jgi:capsular exopolysaccharide synthesis family protein